MLPEKKRLLVVVRTYPTPAQKGIEVSCTAGVTDEGKWIRLFPVPYRLLKANQKFSKYQWIEVDVRKASDPRPESYNISVETLRVAEHLSADNDWQERKNIIAPVTASSLCSLKSQQESNQFPTLGIFKPKSIHRLLIEEDSPTWTQEQLDRMHQIDMFRQAPQEELEKVPFRFRYEFRCDKTSCSGHTLMCTDWEMGESWRKWRQDYGGNWQEKFRETYEHRMIHERDTHFIVGTHSTYPEWLIVGLFYPPKPPTFPLFDGLTP